MVFPQLSVKEFLISLLVLALFGGCVYFYTHPKIKEVEKVREKPVIHEIVQKETINTITAKEKASPKDADLVVNTKDTVKVSINGKDGNSALSHRQKTLRHKLAYHKQGTQNTQ